MNISKLLTSRGGLVGRASASQEVSSADGGSNPANASIWTHYPQTCVMRL